MSEFVPPTIAPQTIAPAPEDGSAPQPAPEAPEPAPITEQEVGEYREQDRFLPVRHFLRCLHLTSRAHPFNPRSRSHFTLCSFCTSLFFATALVCHTRKDCKCVADHEVICPRDGEDLEGGEGVRAGVRVRVHLVHHVRGGGEVPDGEAQDDRRRGHPLRDGHPRVRKLRRDAQDPLG